MKTVKIKPSKKLKEKISNNDGGGKSVPYQRITADFSSEKPH